jgi:MFS family permease
MRLGLRLNIGWFGLLGALAFQGRFLALFFRDRGFTNSEIGFILGSNPLISSVATPLFAYVCDRTGYRRVITILISISIVVVAGYAIASMLSDSTKFVTYFIAYFLFSSSYGPVLTIFDAATLVCFHSLFSISLTHSITPLPIR